MRAWSSSDRVRKGDAAKWPVCLPTRLNLGSLRNVDKTLELARDYRQAGFTVEISGRTHHKVRDAEGRLLVTFPCTRNGAGWSVAQSFIAPNPGLVVLIAVLGPPPQMAPGQRA